MEFEDISICSTTIQLVRPFLTNPFFRILVQTILFGLLMSLKIHVMNTSFATHQHSSLRVQNSSLPLAYNSSCPWIQSLDTTQFGNYSQGVQDGILQIIFDTIGTTNRYFVEFGFGYSGNHVDEQVFRELRLNSYFLRKQGWHGRYFDARIECKEYNISKVVLTEENIGSVFRLHQIPENPDYVSIDIDSIDAWIFQALVSQKSGFRPRVISVEFNSNFAPDMLVSFQRDWHPWTGRSVYGASAATLAFIAIKHEYVPVHIMKVGLDMFFIRSDVFFSHCPKAPSFSDLAHRKIPLGMHAPCLQEDAQRLVHFPTLMNAEPFHLAQQRARQEIVRLEKEFGIKMCEDQVYQD